MMSSEQATAFAPPYRRSSSFHVFAERKDIRFAIKNPVFGTIGLELGDCQVMIKNGMIAIIAATIETINANRAFFANKRTIQIPTSEAIIVSNPVQPYRPLIRRTIVVAVAPAPYMNGTAGLNPFLSMMNPEIHASVAHNANVVRDKPSPVPLMVMTTMYR